jgi:pimeloyl-[acyl-carrier protein] methyl ester esterase
VGAAEAPTTLLLPGFDGTGELFAPLLSAIGTRLSTVVIRYKDEVRFDDYIDSVAARLPERNAVLVAESFSGPIALATAVRHPARIRAIVLCASFAVSPFRPLTRLARFVPWQLFRPNPAQGAILGRYCLNHASDPALLAKALSVIQSVPARTIKSRLELLAELDVHNLLSQVTAPVLYLQALQDKVVGARLSDDLVGGLSDVTVRRLAGPHLLLQCRPDECAEAIIQFVLPIAMVERALAPTGVSTALLLP